MYCVIAHCVREIRYLALDLLEDVLEKNIPINEPDRILKSLISWFEIEPVTREDDVVRLIGKLILVS